MNQPHDAMKGLVSKTLAGRTGKDLLNLPTKIKQEITDAHTPFLAPRNETEKTLQSIWESLLKRDGFGVNDNFFTIGGGSLKAIQLLSRITSRFSIHIQLTDIFNYPTIALLAAHIDRQERVVAIQAPAPAPKTEKIPLSYSQERLWLIDQLEGNTVQYNIPMVFTLEGPLNVDALFYALRGIVQRHEVLRTAIIGRDGIASQEVKSAGEWQPEMTDHDLDDNTLHEFILSLINQPFDLAAGYMLRAHLVRRKPDLHVLVLVMHHIATDGWSSAILMNELTTLYEARINNIPDPLTPLAIQYADFAVWQRTYLESALPGKLQYWKERLEDVLPLQLPADYERPFRQSNRGALVRYQLDADLIPQLEILCASEGVTLFMAMLAAFKVLLYRYSGQGDICVGTPVANRGRAETESLIGFFVNTLALRSNLGEDPSFQELLQQVKTNTLEAYLHQEVPFEKVVDAVVKQRDASRNPLFQVMFAMQDNEQADISGRDFGGLRLQAQKRITTTAKFDLTFYVNRNEDGLQITAEYCTDLYTEPTISRMLGHYSNLLRSAVGEPVQKIGAMQMLDSEELQQLLVAFNNTKMPYPADKTMIALFEEQALKTPEHVAIIFGQAQLTYKELNQRATQLARHLQAKGVSKGDLIPVCLEKGLDMIVSILGIQKAGAAYVPVDPSLPQDRISYMLQNAAARLIVTNAACEGKLSLQEGISMIELDTAWSFIATAVEDDLVNTLAPDDVIHVIFTSGSTGKPKGVMITHRNMVNCIAYMVRTLAFEATSTMLSFSTFSFDIFYLELYMPLTSGGTVVMVEREAVLDGFRLSKEIEAHRPTHLQCTPGLWQLLLNSGWQYSGGLKMITGGDTLNESVMQALLQHGELFNAYGPTETTIYSTMAPMEVTTPVHIGPPMDNTDIYIVDRNGQLCPIGVTGEIWIGGIGVAKGYLGQPVLTAEKFIKDPFSSDPHSRIYKSGDMGKWKANGEIISQGRRDDMVKVRGYRIELGEIIHVLLSCSLVKQATVVVKTDASNNNRLVAYIVPEGAWQKDEILTYLGSKLPAYMVPSTLVCMEQLPLNSNGKVDKKKLPDPDDDAATRANTYVAPRNRIEEDFIEIWKELLGTGTLGIEDNFFEVGGDSIITIQVVNKARNKGYILQPGDLFIYQTISQLAAVVAGRTNKINAGEQGILTGSCGLLPVQQWYLESHPLHVSHYNQSVLLEIDKGIDELQLKSAFRQLMEQHDALRFSFHQEGNNWIQEYGAISEVITRVDLQAAPVEEVKALIRKYGEEYQQSLDIAKGKLVNALLIQTPAALSRNRLLIIIHHLAVDGVSWRILLEDLEKIFNQLPLQEKSASCREWRGVLERYAASKGLLSQELYWQKIQQQYVPLSSDKPCNVQVRMMDIARHAVMLDNDRTRQLLKEVPKVYHTEINDVLLAALAATLCRWTGRQQVIIGLEGHGREVLEPAIDISRTVGWFTSLYPVLLETPLQIKEGELLKSVKEQLRRLPNKGIGYGVLKYINRDPKLQQPCWDIIFNYLGQLDNMAGHSKWLSDAAEYAGANISPENPAGALLTINSMVQGGMLCINWSYSTLHFNAETIEQLARDYQQRLGDIISHCIEQAHNGVVYTPSDYGIGDEISYEELDEFLRKKQQGLDDILSF